MGPYGVLLGLVDGAFEFLLQLFHATHRGGVLGRRLLVHQLTPGLGVLCLHHLGQPITARYVTPSQDASVTTLNLNLLLLTSVSLCRLQPL